MFSLKVVFMDATNPGAAFVCAEGRSVAALESKAVVTRDRAGFWYRRRSLRTPKTHAASNGIIHALEHSTQSPAKTL
jgi:hypothetical protein